MWGTRLNGCNSCSYLISSLSRVDRASFLICEMRGLNQISSKALTFCGFSFSSPWVMFFVFQCIEQAQHLSMFILVLASSRAKGEVLYFSKPLQLMCRHMCILYKIFTETFKEFRMRRMRPRKLSPRSHGLKKAGS